MLFLRSRPRAKSTDYVW